MRSKKQTFLCLFAIVTILHSGIAVADVAVQYHYAGGSPLAADAQLTTLHKVLALKSTENLADMALTRFWIYLTNRLQLVNAPPSTLLVKPLLSDLVGKESVGSIGGASGNSLNIILAIHLEPAESKLWQATFAAIFHGGGKSFVSEGFSGRRWNINGLNSCWLIPASEWLVIGFGDEFSTLQTEYLKQISMHGRPVPELTTNCLEANIDTTRLGGWLRFLKPARIRLAVTTNQDNLTMGASVVEAETIPWKSEAWQIPTNLIRGEIISFTAGMDMTAFLNVNPILTHLTANPLTNQFFLWALDQMPLLNYAAWPTVDASNDLKRLSAEAPAALNPELKQFNGTQLVWNTRANKLTWLNMRMFALSLDAVNDKDGQFLFLSSFPRMFQGKPIPDSLLARIRGRTNLVYYDWELTGRRLSEWQILSGTIANRSSGTNEESFAGTDAELQWINGVAGSVGNTVTEVIRISPNEISIHRLAPLGFTAVELVLLADWLCNAYSGPIHQPSPSGNLAPVQIQP